MNDNYLKFEFDIQLLHTNHKSNGDTCHESNGDSIYIISVYKIYSKNGKTKGHKQYIYIYIFFFFLFNW